MTETTQLSSSINLCCKVEALLFVASEALSVAQLSELCGVKQAEVIETLTELRALYENRGLKLQEFNNRYQITTTPEVSEIIEKMLGLEATAKLSKAALECLAVVAYRQPVTRPGIDAIRGVNSDGVLKSLLSKGLIEEVGRAETPGRPILYGVTDLFLQHFGLDMLSALPPFEVEETVETSGSNGILKD
ncbi:MAG: SMC-Scp complex subunit ScpB [Anaerolineaceae bacterium]